MEVSTRKDGDVIVICPRGKLIGEPYSVEFTTAFNTAIENGEQKIVFDFSGVNWMNSTGISMLIAARDVAQRSRAYMRIAALSNPVKDVLAVSKLDRIFEIHPTVAAAVNSFAPSASS